MVTILFLPVAGTLGGRATSFALDEINQRYLSPVPGKSQDLFSLVTLEPHRAARAPQAWFTEPNDQRAYMYRHEHRAIIGPLLNFLDVCHHSRPKKLNFKITTRILIAITQPLRAGCPRDKTGRQNRIVRCPRIYKSPIRGGNQPDGAALQPQIVRTPSRCKIHTVFWVLQSSHKIIEPEICNSLRRHNAPLPLPLVNYNASDSSR